MQCIEERVSDLTLVRCTCDSPLQDMQSLKPHALTLERRVGHFKVLGLALQASKAPIDILVVDQAEKTPTAN